MTPSTQLLTNTVSLYRYATGQDADAGAVPSNTNLIATGVSCSVQPQGAEMRTINGRVREVRKYLVFFGGDPGLSTKDLIVWTDVTPSRRLFVPGVLDQAGRAVAWAVPAEEVL